MVVRSYATIRLIMVSAAAMHIYSQKAPDTVGYNRVARVISLTDRINHTEIPGPTQHCHYCGTTDNTVTV